MLLIIIWGTEDVVSVSVGNNVISIPFLNWTHRSAWDIVYPILLNAISRL